MIFYAHPIPLTAQVNMQGVFKIIVENKLNQDMSCLVAIVGLVPFVRYYPLEILSAHVYLSHCFTDNYYPCFTNE